MISAAETAGTPAGNAGSLPANTPAAIPSDDTNEVGEPYNPDYETWQEDVKNIMIHMDNVPEEYFLPAEESGDLQYVTYQTKDYDKDMDEETKLALVYTPYGYSPDEPYDILYLMHGYTGDIYSWLGTPEEPSEMKNMLDHMIQDQLMEPMIVVCATYYDNNENEMTDNIDTDLLEPFGQELRNDLMPAVESTFSTYAQSTDEQGLQAARDHRIFGGFSMGGVTTLYRMMDCMDLFANFINLSGPIYWANLVNTQQGDWGASYLKERISKQGFTDKDFYLYMATGSKDEAYPLMDMMAQSMLRQSDFFHFGNPDQSDINVTYGVGEDEFHDGHNCARCLYNILPVMSGRMINSQNPVTDSDSENDGQ